MPQAVDNIALGLEELSEHVRSLESRIAALETRLVKPSEASASRSEILAESKGPCPVGNQSALETRSSETLLQRLRPPATWRGFPPVEAPSGVVPILVGSRQTRVELAWLAYATVGLGTFKLLVEDLRFGNAASLVVSLLFYGLILILLPRVTKRRVSA